jgi:hypothetical protein
MTWRSVSRFHDDHYAVEVREVPTPVGVIAWLYVKRKDGAAITSWDDLQRVKNEIAGPERLAVECYPPQSHVVNKENARHLWVLPAGWTFPAGMALDFWDP